MNANENQIVVYQPNETVRLVGVQKAAISKHLKNIYSTGELSREATVSKMETVQNEGGRMVVREQEFYNLDVIIAVGYRVNSVMATQFRIWATQVLKTYLLKGYAVNTRLVQLEDKIDHRLAKHEDRIATLEQKVDFFVQTQTPPLRGVFYNGQLWDARALVLSLVARAKRSLILVDNWANTAVLDLFTKKCTGVRLTIFTSEHYDRKHVPHRKISPAPSTRNSPSATTKPSTTASSSSTTRNSTSSARR